jgi:hypothetical protein
VNDANLTGPSKLREDGCGNGKLERKDNAEMLSVLYLYEHSNSIIPPPFSLVPPPYPFYSSILNFEFEFVNIKQRYYFCHNSLCKEKTIRKKLIK